MLAPQIALLLGVGLWLVGLRLRQPFGVRQHCVKSEFWWTAFAVFFGGSGALGAMLMPNQGTSDVDVLWRTSPMLLIGVIMVIGNLVRGARVEAYGVLLLVMFALMVAQNIGSTALMAVLSLALFLPGIVVPSGGYSLQAIQAGISFGSAAVIVTLAGFAVSGATGLFGQCRSDKCSLWGMSLGETGAGNAIGMVLAVIATVDLLGVLCWQNYVLIATGSYLLVDLTSSRSALATWIIGIGVGLAFLLSRRTGKKAFVNIAAIVVAAFVAVFPFLGWSPSAFTNRGALWLYAFDLIDRQPWFGYGSSFWVRGEAIGPIDLNYATHNLMLELLVTSGIVGTLLFAVALILASRARGHIEAAVYTTALIGITVGASVTEVFSAPGRTYLMAGMAAMVFVVASAQIAEGTRNVVIAEGSRALSMGPRQVATVHFSDRS